MSPQQLANEANDALKNGQFMTLTRIRGQKPPKGFPRGELLCENHDGRNVYRFDPKKIIEWLNKNRLLAIEVKEQP